MSYENNLFFFKCNNVEWQYYINRLPYKRGKLNVNFEYYIAIKILLMEC